MKRKQITLKGWANQTNYIGSENVSNNKFMERYHELRVELTEQGYKELKFYQELRGMGAVEKIDIYAHYWRGSWVGGVKQKFATFYK